MPYNSSIAVPYSTKLLLLYITFLAGRAIRFPARAGERASCEVRLPPLCVRFAKTCRRRDG
jgi:hypothetical protein